MTEKTKAGLFDLRWILALLFAIYGAVLTVIGVGDTTPEDLEKTGGINVNLWVGVSMLAAAAVFALWARLRPLTIPDGDPGDDPDRTVPETGTERLG